MNRARIDSFHKSRPGYLIFGLLELAIAYLIGSRAVDTGSWWEYFFSFIFLFGGLRNLLRTVILNTRYGK